MVVLNPVIKIACDAVACHLFAILVGSALPHCGEAIGYTSVGSVAQLVAYLTISAGNYPLDTVVAHKAGSRALTLVGDAGGAASLDEQAQNVVPLWVHEVRIEQAWGARHRQDEGVGLNDVPLHTVLIGLAVAPVVVRTVGWQVLEGVVVVEEGDGIALEHRVTDKTRVVQYAVVAVVECLTNIALQWEVEGSALVGAFHVGLMNPVRDIVLRSPVFTHAEGGSQGGVVLGKVPLLEAHSIVIAIAHIAQVILQEVEELEDLGASGRTVVVDVASPFTLAAAVGVTSTASALVVGAHVIAGPLDVFALWTEGALVVLSWKLDGVLVASPGAQAAAVVGHHVFDGSSAFGLVGGNELTEFSLGAEVGHWSPGAALTVGVGPGGTIGIVR